MDHHRAMVKREIFKGYNDKMSRPLNNYITGLKSELAFKTSA